ncbi:MAG: type II secretion system protein [Methylovulum sp.]|nr:type II secretion system protein [Methylovulum sp.]
MRKQQFGFTLIEVLIASAIVGAAMGLLLQLFTSATVRMHKAAGHAHIMLAQKQIHAALQTLNPSLLNHGGGVAEGITYQWTAEKKTPGYPIYDEGIMTRKFSIYNIIVELQLADGKTNRLQWEQLAWE